MSLLTAMMGARERRSTLRNPADWLYDALTGGEPTASGERVSHSTALTLSAYFACIRNIAEDVAKVPFPVYRRRKGRGKDRVPNHRVHEMLNVAPSDEMSAMTFRETLTGHAPGWGDGVAEIKRRVVKSRAIGEPIAMYPLNPANVTMRRADDDSIWYIYREGTREEKKLPAYNVLHIHGLGFDGLRGYSIAHMARQSIGAGLAEIKSGASLFGQGARPGGILKYEKKLDPQTKEALRKAWERLYQGADKRHRTAVLDQGVTFDPIIEHAKDAQWVEAKQLTVEEMARWTRMPPHKIQHLLRATYSNIESQAIEYVVDCLLSWFVRWEQEVNRKLLFPYSSSGLFAEHVIEGLLRGDIKTRYEAFAIGRMWGWHSANDVLDLENRNPIGEQGDIYLVPANYVPAEQLLEPPEPEPPVAPVEPPTEEPDEAQAASLKLLVADEVRRLLREKTGCQISDIAASYGPILQAAYRKALKVEISQASKRASWNNPDEWVQKFYPEHRMYLEGLLLPVAKAFASIVWSVTGDGDMPGVVDDAVADAAAGMAERHVGRSKAELAESSGGAFGDICQEWENGRAERVAAEEMGHLQTLVQRLCAGGEQN